MRDIKNMESLKQELINIDRILSRVQDDFDILKELSRPPRGKIRKYQLTISKLEKIKKQITEDIKKLTDSMEYLGFEETGYTKEQWDQLDYDSKKKTIDMIKELDQL